MSKTNSQVIVATGPRTVEGKAICAGNAIKHGLRSERVVVPGIGETQDDWLDFRLTVIQSLQPAPGIETLLADRAASLLWRLQRLTGYETGWIQTYIEQILEPVPPTPTSHFSIQPSLQDQFRDFQQKQHEQEAKVQSLNETIHFLQQLLTQIDTWPEGRRIPHGLACEAYACISNAKANGYPAAWKERSEYHFEPTQAGIESWEEECAWSIQEWRNHLQRATTKTGRSIEELVQTGIAYAKQLETEAKYSARYYQTCGDRIAQPVQQQQRFEIARCVVPDDPTTTKLVRYEAHLQKQLTATLHQLERLQAKRAGQPVVPPIAVDVVVEHDADNL